MADEQAVSEEVVAEEELQTEEVENEEQSEVETETEGSDDEVVITLAGESPSPEEEEQEQAPEWVKTLRKQNREQSRENRRLQAELDALKAKTTETKPVVLGPEPKMSDPDVDYDEEKLNAKRDKWMEQKREIAAAQAQEAKAKQDAQDAWNKQLESYEAKKSALKVQDFEDAEEVAKSTLNVMQQSIIIASATDPAVVTYVLGRNPTKAKELAAITDPLKFARAIWELETKGINMTSRKAPPPERPVAGSGSQPKRHDAALNKLREEAVISGDMSKVMAYKRKHGLT